MNKFFQQLKAYLPKIILSLIWLIISLSLTDWLTNNGVVQLSGTIFLILIIILPLVIIFLISKIRDLNTTIKNFPQNNGKFVRKEIKKDIRNSFVIDNINHRLVDWEVSVRRCWLPNKPIPPVREFVNEFILSEPRCVECGGEYIQETSNQNILCSSPDCSKRKLILSKEMKITESEVSNVGEKLLNDLKGKTVKDESVFDDYWSKYINKYDEYTGSKYDKYFEPLRLSYNHNL